MGKNTGCERALCPSRKVKGTQRLGAGDAPCYKHRSGLFAVQAASSRRGGSFTLLFLLQPNKPLPGRCFDQTLEWLS